MKNILFTCLVLLLVSCYNQNKPNKPDNLISKDKMVSVIIDMSMYSSAKGVNKKILENNGVKLQELIFKKHNIDSAQFANSNYYYTYHTEDYEVIYKQVRDSLTKLKAEYTALDKIESEQKKINDSIKQSKLKNNNLMEAPLETALNKKNRFTPVKSN
ncbi:DUF4296 domain-containing protein [Oceanihabitans sp. 2_MG-2023]|uniref:DUF4296 domain-containing protein n=1 Tax=Oceanihabitans sp. 2_MG-2023 TaxID=3062661 RepID=UPI0026E22548|nr:DUF4296 domain-containing protein [Oceanihabitans sp. 2_MG-2023]MDO6595495.1 DUF4296 domain-containing protein [Oceanihabitans sp. 2_MG-2023]